MKRHSIIGTVLIALTLLVATACDDTDKGPRKERSVGGTSEILVVTQNEEQWDGMIGDTIRAFFLQEQYGLPQPESINKLAHLNSSGFNDMFKKHKCILLVEINPNLEKPIVETSEDLWSAPQRVLKVMAPDRTSWCKVFEEQKQAYKLMFDRVERERILSILRPSNDEKITKQIKKKFGFDMVIPSGFFISKNQPDFMWIRKELDKNSFGIFIYTTPYKDTVQLELNGLVTVRDRMLQRYVPGPSEGSFMTTEKEFVPPLVSYTANYPTGFAAEMRGMWCLIGDYMAGPFISYTFPDNNTGNLVTVEGYVYYPNHDKRDDLLQLQSLLYSIQFPKEKEETLQ